MMRRALVAGLVGLFLFGGLFTEACFITTPQPNPIELVEDHVQVELREGVAVQHIRMVFHNPNPMQTEGEYFMELEPDSQVESLEVTIGGKKMEAELLDSQKARQLYEQIVAEMKDPALLEYYGSQMIRARVFPLPPNADFEVQVSMRRLLRSDAGVTRLVTMQTNPKAVMKSLRQATFQATIQSSSGIKSVFSPTHTIDVARRDDNNVAVSFEAEHYLPTHPLVLYYTQSADPIGAHVLAFEQGEDRGYFMLTITPEVEVSGDELIPKDLIFAMDTSGSMKEEGKLEQARGALLYCLQSLKELDRFNVITFSTEARLYSEELVEASGEAIDRAVAYVRDLKARGGTAFHEAVMAGVEQLAAVDGGRMKMLVVMTDGKPTVGTTDTDAILSEVVKSNTSGVRVYSFGVGAKVNTRLLDGLVRKNHGAADYVLPQESIEWKVSAFYDKVDRPVLSNVRVAIDGIREQELYPKEMPDLFAGTSVVLLGRYEKGGSADAYVKLTGAFRGSERAHDFELTFAPSANHEFLPRLWAGRKIGYLLEQLKVSGEQKELIDELVRLAKKHGIVTPYTSYLIVEDQELAMRQAGDELRRRLQSEEESDFSGEDALSGARAGEELKDSEGFGMEELEKSAQGLLGDSPDARRKLMQRLRHVGTRTFYRRANEWVDSAYGREKFPEETIEVIKYLSERYFALIRANPSLARALALGDRILLVHAGRAYRIVP